MHRRKLRGNRLSQQDTWGTQSLSCRLAKRPKVLHCGQIMLLGGDQIMVKPKHWFIWQGQGGLLLLTVVCLCGGYATQRKVTSSVVGDIRWGRSRTIPEETSYSGQVVHQPGILQIYTEGQVSLMSVTQIHKLQSALQSVLCGILWIWVKGKLPSWKPLYRERMEESSGRATEEGSFSH